MAAQGYARVLEVKLVSAQDLAPVSKSMKTYAVVWVDPLRKMTTRVDQLNDANPIWDDKFVFRVDDKFLSAPDSALEVEIYAAAWTRDALIGTVRVLVSDLLAVSTSTRFTHNINNKTMRYMELQVWRPSGRPQGMVTMGVALLDSTLRSMPLSTEQMVSGFRGEKNVTNPKHTKQNITHNYHHTINEDDSVPRRLRRSHSDQTELTTSEISGCTYPNATTSAITASTITDSAIPSVVEKGGESIVNSDLGPSASVVAEAIAKAMYLKHKAAVDSNGSESDIVVKTEKQEKRREKATSSGEEDGKKEKRERRRRRRKGEAGRGLFSCFGKVLGIEISITCGGRSGGRKSPKKKSNKVCNLSSVLDDGYSQSNS